MALGMCRLRSGVVLSRLSFAADGQPTTLVVGNCLRLQVANLTATYGEKYPYAEPFPYERKSFNWYTQLFDNTLKRFNDNTKDSMCTKIFCIKYVELPECIQFQHGSRMDFREHVLVVEGNVGVGKTEFAKRLAKDFDLKFFPPTPEKRCFIDKAYNFDIRKLDPVFPEDGKAYDLKKFLSDPHPERGKVGRLQLAWYEEKFYDYLLALKHLLSTGQGVVLVRSVYSDAVFVDALHSLGWLTTNFVKHYNMVRANSICDLFKPHLTIYLDAPTSVIRDRLKARNNPIEVGSRNLTDDYLKAIERAYQQRFLPKMRESGEVVEIDWTEIATDTDMHAIAEELQMVKLEGEDNDDPKFSDWSRLDEDDFSKFRLSLEDPSTTLEYFTRTEPWDCPEMLLGTDDLIAMAKIYKEHPVFKYRPGWAPELGHRTLLKF